MTNYLSHKDVGAILSKSEFEAADLHQILGEAADELLKHDGTGWTNVAAAVVAALIDHGLLLGLADDDHTQYLNTTRHDTTDRHPLGTVVDGNKVTGLDDITSVLSLFNRTTSIDWTDLDLTAYTSAATKFVVLRVQLFLDSYTSGHVYFAPRKNGATQYCVTAFAVTGTGERHEAVTIVPTDSGQVIEYKLEISGTAQVDVGVWVTSYIE